MYYLAVRINPAIFSTSRHVIIDCDGILNRCAGEWREGGWGGGEVKKLLYGLYRFAWAPKGMVFTCFDHKRGIDFSHFDHKQGFELENLNL